MEIDDYEIHTDLVERFILNGDKHAFKKMLNMNLTSSTNNKIEKQKENLLRKQNFMKSMKPKKPTYFYNNFHMNNHFQDNYKTFKPGEINDFKIDFHNFIQDPEYKDKCMKGNYKWGNMRFQMMKANLAKRKGIPVEELKMPKIWGKKKSSNMELNGNYIMNNKIGIKQYSKDKLTKKEDNKNNNFLFNKYGRMMTMNKKSTELFKKQLSNKIPNNINTLNL